MHIAVGFHVPDDAAAAVEDLCLAVPSLSSVDHIPLFLGVEFRTKIAYAEGLLGIKTHCICAEQGWKRAWLCGSRRNYMGMRHAKALKL